MADRLAVEAQRIADALPLLPAAPDVNEDARCACGAELPRTDHLVDRADRLARQAEAA